MRNAQIAKKVGIETKKAAIGAKDIAKGIYVHDADLPRQEQKRAVIQSRPRFES